MRRREFITMLGGVAAISLAARGQQNVPTVGYLHSASADFVADETAAFRRGLQEAGYVAGQNVEIEYRWAEGKPDRIPALAADLVQRHVAVIAAIGGDATALAAKAATATIPIVFLNGSDPVKSGLVNAINSPGGQITGVSLFAGTVDSKRLELLHELVPRAGVVAVFNNSSIAETDARSKALADAGSTIGLKLLFVNVRSDADLDPAFASIAQREAQALFVSGSPFFLIRRGKLVTLAARNRIPAIYAWRQFVVDGGLVSYGTSFTESARQAGVYVGQILKGIKPADLPVLQPTKFEFTINLKTAKALGLSEPPTLLARADEVIE
jgi:putative tryptophan/tyrosine transport system substrate-binding protein